MSLSIGRRSLFLAVVLAAQCGSASSKPARVGVANVSGVVQGTAAAQIDHVTVTITGAALPASRVRSLERLDPTHYGGTVAELPASHGYLFVVEAMGSGSPAPVLFRGQQADVTIAANRAAEVVVPLEGTGAERPPSPVPVIDGLSASATTAAPGASVRVTVVAHGGDGHGLTYAWQSDCGTFVDRAQPSTDWTAPLTGGTCGLSVRVTDPIDATSATGSLAIEVGAPDAGTCIAGQSCTPADTCGLSGVTVCSAPDAPAACSATGSAPDGTPCTGADGAGTCRQGGCVAPPSLAEGMVTISFDDGTTSQLLALPALEQHGFHATFFVITRWAGGPGYLGASDLRALASSGHEIASHSVDHPHLPTLPDAAVWSELADSQTWLVTNVAPDAGRTFACPFGQYDERVLAASRELYRAHRTGETRFNRADADPALLGEVVATGTLAQLEAYVDRAIAERTWLILGFHKLTTAASPAEYTYDVDAFAALLDYLAARRVRVVTVAEGVGYLSAPPAPPAGP